MCDMIYSYVWRDSFKCVAWLLRMCDMAHSYDEPCSWVIKESELCSCAAQTLVWLMNKAHSYDEPCSWVIKESVLLRLFYYSSICVTWLIHMRHDSLFYMCLWRALFVCATRSYTLHTSFICVTWRTHLFDFTRSDMIHMSGMTFLAWLIHMNGKTFPPVWRYLFICVAWRIYTCNMTHLCEWHDSICVCDMPHSLPLHMCGMMRSHVWHDSFMWMARIIYVSMTCLIDVCAVTHSCAWHVLFICVAWPVYMCDTTHSYVWHDSLICAARLIDACDMTHPPVWHVV